MRRIAWLIATAVVALGATGFAFLHVVDGIESANASTQQSVTASTQSSKPAKTVQSAPAGTSTKTYSMKVAGLKRSYEVFAPVKALPKSAPIIVMLAGYKASVSGEVARDQLVPYATAGKAEVIYPVPVDESWNAIGCCGYANTHKVNDLAFMKALVAKVDPGNKRSIYVVGYSNGARLAYRVACTDPALFDGYAMVKGVPITGCKVTKPVTLIQVASVDDPEIPYKPGDKGLEPLAVTTLMGQLHSALKCPAKSAVTHAATMTQTTWSGCAGGARLASAVWAGGVHSFPRPPGSKPAASAVIWSFFTKTKLAPVP
jgi:polyhydroxybutyrate depolymerase